MAKLSLKSYLWATRAQAYPPCSGTIVQSCTSRWEEPVQRHALMELLDVPTRPEWSTWWCTRHPARPPAASHAWHTHSDSTSTQPQRRPRAGSLISSTNIVPCGDEGHQDVKLLGLMERFPISRNRRCWAVLQLWVGLPAAKAPYRPQWSSTSSPD